jgi:putative ABC transport system permease protein
MLRRLALIPGSPLLPIATAAAVFWEEREDPEEIAVRIRKHLGHVSVVSPADAAQQLDRALGFMNGVVLGSGLVALLVASLAVTNTMFTALVERRREIGLRRVVGATRRQVIAQLLLEAAGVGTLGALLGLAVGTAAIVFLNALTERLGAPVFLLTPRLVLAATLLPAVLAALAGLWPALRAARLPPTVASHYV